MIRGPFHRPGRSVDGLAHSKQEQFTWTLLAGELLAALKTNET
jgi:hypothetical protein